MTARSLSALVCLLSPLALAACGGSKTQERGATTLTAAPRAQPQPEPRVEPPPPFITALARGAFPYAGLGDHRWSVRASPEAKAYFDQGLRLTYAFNHDEAARSFAKGAELDPSCAMCFWGVAYVFGPNYNVPMLASRAPAAWEALQRARALAPRTSPVEQAMIEALSRRYKGPAALEPAAMVPFNQAYAEAMRAVARRFSDDDDVQVLYAEALMDVNPWKLWAPDGSPAPGTEVIVATLETVLARSPNHPGANHFYIHAIEASRTPEKGVPAAERLGALMPAAGHVVHMPAHIFQRVGRYADASAANEQAILADQAYLRRTEAPGYYPMYLGHNYGFLAFSASMEGRRDVTLTAARESARAIPPEMLDMMPGMDFMAALPMLAMVRFGEWDQLLAEPRPAAKYPVLTGFWLHGHGMALAAKGRLADARQDHAELVAVRDRMPEEVQASNNRAKDILAVGAKVLEARIATVAREKDSLTKWAEAVSLADRLSYAEPDDWFYPVRHYYGAALLSAGKAKEAERVYREDLRVHPGNGWALFGLSKSLDKQGLRTDALETKTAFDQAWARTDFTLTTTAP